MKPDAPKHHPRTTHWLNIAWQLPLGPHLVFRLNLVISIGYTLVLILLIHLGFWQLERRTLKQQHNTQVSAFLARQHQPLSLTDAMNAYQEVGQQASDVTVRVHGKFVQAPLIFHDNRINQGQPGLNVLALFRPTPPPGGKAPTLIVNLGWVHWPGSDRQRLPTIALPVDAHDITGALFIPNPNTWTLEHTLPAPTPAGWLLQKIDLAQIEAQIDHPVAPFTLRLKPDSWPSTVAVDQAQPVRTFTASTQWPISPEKHLGYALQWFTLATALTVIFVVVNLQQLHHTHDHTDKSA